MGRASLFSRSRIVPTRLCGFDFAPVWAGDLFGCRLDSDFDICSNGLMVRAFLCDVIAALRTKVHVVFNWPTFGECPGHAAWGVVGVGHVGVG